MSEFEKELRDLINHHSIENGSDTPDFILAEFMCNCLQVFSTVVKKRDMWYDPKGEFIDDGGFPTNDKPK